MSFISDVRVYIDFSGGNFQLKRLDTTDEDDDSKTEVVPAMGVRGGAGHRDREGGGSLKLEVFHETIPEVNWRALKVSKEVFSLTYQDGGAGSTGDRWQYQGCRVSSVSRKDDSQGKHMDSVEVVWLQRRQLPTLF